MDLSLSPLTQNVCATIATVVYVKTVMGFCDLCVDRKWIPSKVSRKIVHVSAGSWIVFWPLFSEEHWTWRLNILVPAIYSVQLFVKGFIIQDPNDTDVKTMSRSGKPIELCYGPLLFTIIMNICGLELFMKPEGIYVMACLGFGDGIAPLVGHYFPFGYYPTFPFGPRDKKTLSGSLGFFVSSIVGFLLLKAIILGKGVDNDWPSMMRMAFAGTVAEAASGAMDNPFIASAVYVTSKYSY
jgi:phytol kinase